MKTSDVVHDFEDTSHGWLGLDVHGSTIMDPSIILKQCFNSITNHWGYARSERGKELSIPFQKRKKIKGTSPWVFVK